MAWKLINIAIINAGQHKASLSDEKVIQINIKPVIFGYS